MPLKVYDYECPKCERIFRDMLVDSDEKVKCSECNKEMTRICNGPRSKGEGRFQPFWSDTMQMRINDREDLAKLRQYAKDNGLTNVGHTSQRPDRAAIRHNYEND